MPIQIAKELCTGCGQCVMSCQMDAIVMTPAFLAEVSNGICIDCFICLEYCPNHAITALKPEKKPWKE